MRPRRSRRSSRLVSVLGGLPAAAASSDTVRLRPSARLASALISEALRSRPVSCAVSACKVAWVARCSASRADQPDGTDSEFTISYYTTSCYVRRARRWPAAGGVGRRGGSDASRAGHVGWLLIGVQGLWGWRGRRRRARGDPPLAGTPMTSIVHSVPVPRCPRQGTLTRPAEENPPVNPGACRVPAGLPGS